MTELLGPQVLPLRMDSTGTIRVGGTRVTLDTIVSAFWRGATAEEISHQYPTVPLPDIYTVVGYYLNHREAVDKYLARRADEAAKVRELVRPLEPGPGMRQRLMARRAAGQGRP